MARNRAWLAALGAAALIGCGGGDKKVEEPAPEPAMADEEPADSDDVLIPEEKFVEIRSILESKVTTLDSCHPDAVEAGEISGSEKVTVTVGLTIQPDGSPVDVRILERSKKAPTLERCVVEAVGRWLFPTLPKPLETSHIYTLQNF